MVQHWKSEAARVQKLTKHGNRLALVMNRPVLELPKIECYPCHRAEVSPMSSVWTYPGPWPEGQGTMRSPIAGSAWHWFGPGRDPGLKARELCEAQSRVPHGIGLDLAGTLA